MSVTIFQCSAIGTSGTTPVHVKRLVDGTFEARMGIAILGSTNMDPAGYEACGFDPFSHLFWDNFASGTGTTEEEAIAAMKADQQQINRTLWL